MKIDLVSSELCLTNGNPIRLTKACGVRIRCISGIIWITLPDRLADIFLGIGESYLIDAQGLVLVESINEGRVSVEMAAKSHTLTEWLEWPRGLRIKCWKTQFNASI